MSDEKQANANSQFSVPVAVHFNAIEAGLTRSFLEGYGLAVVAAPTHLINNASHWATALGGSPLFVPASQVRDAIELLHSVDNEPEPQRRARRWFFRLMLALTYIMLTGLSAAPFCTGRVVRGEGMQKQSLVSN